MSGRAAGERDPARVVAFSDGVIAIAVTLLVLDLRAPADTSHLVRSLAALWPSYVSYVITFMLVAQVWANHHVLFDHIRHADRLLLFLNAVLLMDIAVIPFAASVLANAFRDGQGERTAVLLHGLAFEVAAGLFNLIWWYARRDRRLLADTIDAAGVRAVTRRFQLALTWIGAATVLGALLPLLGVCLFASFLAYYWTPVSGELGVARPRAAAEADEQAAADGAANPVLVPPPGMSDLLLRAAARRGRSTRRVRVLRYCKASGCRTGTAVVRSLAGERSGKVRHAVLDVGAERLDQVWPKEAHRRRAAGRPPSAA